MEIAPIAQLLTIDIGRLQEGDKEEGVKLFKAANKDGIFYLDFQNEPFIEVNDAIDEVFALSKQLFNLSEEEKMKYDVDKLSKLKLNGYKPVGRNFGGINGKRDGFESYTVPGKAHLDLSFARPSILTSRLPSLTTFFTQSHRILALLLSSLSISLNTSLTDLHRNNAPSPDILRLLHYVAQPPSETGAPQAPHTDLGSLTLLFANSSGLQVLPQHSTDWAFVIPKTGCAIVNIGDGLTMLTGGLLHSCLHRVVPLPGRAMEERYSFAYLQRTEDNVKMEALPGLGKSTVNEKEVYTSGEWLEKKFGMLRRKASKEEMKGQKITGCCS